MRLSEAMMLGSVTVKMVKCDLNSCALGAACNALGIPAHEPTTSIGHSRWKDIARIWPWTDQLGSYRDSSTPLEAIYRAFDSEVCKGKMTFEQLVDYVRSVEPSCACNRFDCTCKPAEVPEAIEVNAHA